MQEAPTPPVCEVVILTALGLEYKAVSEHLQDMQEVTHQGTVYEYGNFTGQNRTWHVAVAEIGMGGPTAAAETERAISYFRPQITLFVGIAGGLKDVKIGDVVAASKVYAYESGKVEQQFQPRPEAWRASHALEQRARAEAHKDQWLTLLGSSRPDLVPQVHIGALAAGEKVLASTQSDLFRLLKATYGDALAVEMEGHGFQAAVHANQSVHALVIRGISDLIDGKSASDATGSQTVAARHAAAFAFQVLAKFTLSTSDGTSSSPSSPVAWNVPYSRNPHFTGRDELLNQLYQRLMPAEQSDPVTLGRVALTQPQAIKGLGGVGKTQIAVEFAYRSREQGHYTHILWINAASEETIITSFVTIAELLPAFSRKNEIDQRKLVEAVKRWLEQCEQRWLLIFDNADDVSIVQGYLPQRGNGSILLTTRADAVGSLALSVEVEPMSFIEGTHLLLRRAQRFEHASDEEVNKAGNIVVALDHFPLALDQAGAYIEETKCSLVDYLEIYQNHRKALLARRGTQTTNYPDSVATTWSVSFQKIEQANPAATELLRLCAFLAPDHIPEELIREGAAYWPPLLQQTATDLLAFNQIIAELLKFSLAKRLVEDHTLSIHRLVQAVQMDMMEPKIQRQWAERVVRAVNSVFPGSPRETATWPQCLRYLEQAQACDSLIRQYRLIFAEVADLLNRTGVYLADHASYTLAESLYVRALSIREQELGPQHLDTAKSLNHLAELRVQQGKHQQAEMLYLRALTILEQQSGPQHSDTATVLNNLAELYRRQGKYGQAEPLLQRALTIYEQQFGPQHTSTAAALHHLALLYEDQGKYEQIESLLMHTLAICEQQFGPQDISTATNLGNLAVFYVKLGKYKQAEPLLQRALTITEQQLGGEHPKTATALSNLATLYYNQGKYTQVESLYQRVLSIDTKAYGADHPKIATDLSNLASLYSSQGKYKEAEPLYIRALAIREQQLGREHPDTALSLNNLAHLYLNQGKSTEAESLYIRALAIYEQQLGAEHPNTALSLDNLAVLYSSQGKYKEAEPLYRRALAIREQQLGREHPDTALSLDNLAFLYSKQGKYTEAEPLYIRALEIYEQQLGAEHPDTVLSLNDLASFYSKQGKYKEAEPVYQRVLSIDTKVYGADHPKIATDLSNLASLYSKQGKYKEAEPLYIRALAISEQQLGEEHLDTALSLNNLATLYSKQGKYTEAEPLYIRALAIHEQQLGAEHPATALSLNNLAYLYSKQGKYKEAESLYRCALAIYRCVLGREHSQTQTVYKNYAYLLRRMGRDDEAKKLEDET